MSGLTKKTVIADQTLSTLLGVDEGELVSYAQLSKGLHQYIKTHDLKNPQLRLAQPPTSQPSPTEPSRIPAPSATPQQPAVASVGSKKCRDCGSDIPGAALFCDLCGVKQ